MILNPGSQEIPRISTAGSNDALLKEILLKRNLSETIGLSNTLLRETDHKMVVNSSKMYPHLN